MTDIPFDDLKQMLIKNCMLRVSPDEIHEDTKLFGPDSLGLDSIDALQMTVAIEKDYGIAVASPDEARDAFQSLGHLRTWLQEQLKKKAA